MKKLIARGNQSFFVDPRPHTSFWNRVAKGEWEPETFAIFDEYINDRTLFLDIGAWIGSTALYGAQLAQRCLAFEPDPLAFKELEANVSLNAEADWADRLEIHQCAISHDGKPFLLGGRHDRSDSMSSRLFPDIDNQWTVSARTLDDVLSETRGPGQPVFLKIDTEGSEYDLIPEISDIIADESVTSYVSYHPLGLRQHFSIYQADTDWKPTYIEKHLRILDSLPWQRRISSSEGQPVSRTDLEEELKQSLNFPNELLIN